jgi:flagellar motor switch protein FliM
MQLFTRAAETLAERYQDELGRWLNDTEIKAGPVTQLPMAELANGKRDVTVLKAVYQITHGVIATDLDLALAAVTRLCGGVSAISEVRPLSRLETGVFDLVLRPLLDLVEEIFEIGSTELGLHVTSPSALPDPQNEAAVAIPLEISAGDTSGKIIVGLSGAQLKLYIEEIDRRIAGQVASARDEPNHLVVQAVQPVLVELIAGFEPMQVPARQLVGLQVGDVLRTRQSVTRPLIARVGDERLFHIRPAQRGQRLVAEVTEPAESGGAGALLGDGGTGTTRSGGGRS